MQPREAENSPHSFQKLCQYFKVEDGSEYLRKEQVGLPVDSYYHDKVV